MTKQATKNRLGVTPARLALVAVLAVVQVVVFVRALRHRSEAVAQTAPAAVSTGNTTSASRAAPRQPTTTPTAATAQEKPTSWPEVSLEEALKFNPFQKPQWLAAAMPMTGEPANPTSEVLEQMKQQGASIVVVTGDGKAATIGDQQFRIGDVIDGYQVTDITVRGVEFTKLPPQ